MSKRFGHPDEEHKEVKDRFAAACPSTFRTVPRSLPPDMVDDNKPPSMDTKVMNDITREEMDAKLEATNARVDARLAGFESTVRETLAAVRQDSAETRGELKAIHVELTYLKNLKANIWGAAVVTIGLVGAMLAYGVASFDSGRDTAQLVQEVKQQSADARKLLEDIQAQQRATASPVNPVPTLQPSSPQQKPAN